jgi:phosphoglucosamine mutase
MMKKNNFNLGGEQSGHIILGKFATTGDGLLVALETLFALKKGKLASEIFKVYKSVPQKLLNIKVKDKKIINSSKCKRALRLAKEQIKNRGRLLVRPSGTEPKIRIMCESFNHSLMNQCINIIKKTIR